MGFVRAEGEVWLVVMLGWCMAGGCCELSSRSVEFGIRMGMIDMNRSQDGRKSTGV